MKPFLNGRRVWVLLVWVLTVSSVQGDLPATREEFLRIDRVWDLELNLTPEAWEAMEPRPGAMNPEGFRPGRDPGGPGPENRDPGPNRPHIPGSDREGPPPQGRPGPFQQGPGGMPPPGGFEFPWVLGKVTVGGVVFTNVGVRFKGNSSFNGSRGSLKRPFKLDFDRHVPGRTLAGLEELFLNNNANDPSQLRESLAYSAFAKAGVPAPRTTGLRVWLRRGDSEPRQYLGLYTGAEPVEGDFLKRHFGSKRGLLTKPERVRGLEYLGDRWSAYVARYETRSTVRTADARRFMHLLRDLNESTDPTFIETMKREVDVDGLLRFVAVNAWLANYDSFLGNGHNYYLFMPSEGPLHFIAWDLNEAFGRHPMAGSAHEQATFSILHPAVAPNAFLERFLNQPEWRDRYQTLVRSLGEGSGACSTQSLLADLAILRKARSEALVDEPRGGFGGRQGGGPGREEFPPGNRPRRPDEQRLESGPPREAAVRPNSQPGESPERRPGPMFDNTPLEDWILDRHRQVQTELDGHRTAPAPRLRLGGGPGPRPTGRFNPPATGGPDPIPWPRPDGSPSTGPRGNDGDPRKP